MKIVIRDMTENEMDGKAYVHWRSWQETYRGLIDETYLTEKVTLESCQRIAHRWPDNILVAMVDGSVVGFCGYGPYRSDDLTECGEIFALYVLRDYQGQRIGYRLMQAAMKRLNDYKKIALWVLKGNENAIRFYRRVGFVPDGVSQTIQLGSPNTEVRMILEKA